MESAQKTAAAEKVLEVTGLVTEFVTPQGVIRAVDELSFTLYRGQTLGIVGESGCGKSVTSLSLLRLIPSPGRIVGGTVLYKGQNLLKLPLGDLRRIRGNRIAMIFQEPMTALNPVMKIGAQVEEVLAEHLDLTRAQRKERVVSLLKDVGIPEPERRAQEYPHQLSGGMRQRVMIAMALACDPDVLIADEPTTALDVTIQAQILELLRDLQKRKGMALILITHDLGVVAEMADDVMVMYAGRSVEQGRADQVLGHPRMPYTQGLLRSLRGVVRGARLEAIPGIVPSLLHLPPGCRFQDRCKHVVEQCRVAEPVLREIAPDARLPHAIRCVREIEWRPS